MDNFLDPRTEPAPSSNRSARPFAETADDLTELHALCRDSRLYDVERWIASNRPLQLARSASHRRVQSALETAIETGNHSLALLLLANGYDANEEVFSPLDLPLRNRRLDLLALLLDWGADPHAVDLDDLFGTYNSELFERFRLLGVDFCDGHALAAAIAYHTSNKPLLGFIKRHLATEPRYQRELDMALAHHAHEGSEKGVQLCLWAGADPHARVPSLRFSSSRRTNDDNEDDELLSSAIYEACQRGHDEILKRFRPDPVRDDFDELWRSAGSERVIDLLAKHHLPRNAGAVVQHHLWWTTFVDPWRHVAMLRHVFHIGLRWTEATLDEIGQARRALLKTSDTAFVDLLSILTSADHCASHILVELARTPSMIDRMKKVGFIPSQNERDRQYAFRPTRSREILQRLGVALPKPKPLPRVISRSVTIGNSQERVRLSREELFERVWAKPVDTVAKECGMSGRGLKKVCERLSVPVPPRGYWARVSAGKPVRRMKLPPLPTTESQ
jgi:ankyrin repeat protein